MHHNGETLDQKETIQAVRTGNILIGNANANLLHLQRERVVSELNKALLPIVGDDENFKEAAPFCPKEQRYGGASKSHEIHHLQEAGEEATVFSEWPPHQSGGLLQTVWKGWSPKLPPPKR